MPLGPLHLPCAPWWKSQNRERKSKSGVIVIFGGNCQSREHLNHTSSAARCTPRPAGRHPPPRRPWQRPQRQASGPSPSAGRRCPCRRQGRSRWRCPAARRRRTGGGSPGTARAAGGRPAQPRRRPSSPCRGERGRGEGHQPGAAAVGVGACEVAVVREALAAGTAKPQRIVGCAGSVEHAELKTITNKRKEN